MAELSPFLPLNLVAYNSFFGEPALNVWTSDEFFVAAFADAPSRTVRLDVCRHDHKDGITWDQLQAIKAAVGFGDRDAFEPFPSDDAVINTGNWRHVYVLPPGARLPAVRR